MNHTFGFTFDEEHEPKLYDISFHVGEDVHYVRYFDRRAALDYGEAVATCVDVSYVDMLNARTGEVLYHFKEEA